MKKINKVKKIDKELYNLNFEIMSLKNALRLIEFENMNEDIETQINETYDIRIVIDNLILEVKRLRGRKKIIVTEIEKAKRLKRSLSIIKKYKKVKGVKLYLDKDNRVKVNKF